MGERLSPEQVRGCQTLRYSADMVAPTEPFSISNAADILNVDADALLDEIRNAAAEAERPSARD